MNTEELDHFVESMRSFRQQLFPYLAVYLATFWSFLAPRKVLKINFFLQTLKSVNRSLMVRVSWRSSNDRVRARIPQHY